MVDAANVVGCATHGVRHQVSYGVLQNRVALQADGIEVALRPSIS